MCEEAPEPTEIITHILGADEDTRHKESGEDIIPYLSHEVPDIAFRQGLK